MAHPFYNPSIPSRLERLAATSSDNACYYFAACGQHAELEKGGRMVCRGCAPRVQGTEYPLRPPRWTEEPDGIFIRHILAFGARNVNGLFSQRK